MSDFLLHLRVHAFLAGTALLPAIVLGALLGLAAYERRALRGAVLSLVATMRVVPSLAVLMLLLPWLGIGSRPAIIALMLLAVAPVAIAVEAGLRGVAPAVVESARALGMHGWTLRRRVIWPLALPVAFSGVRTAAVETVASATLAAFVGGGGLGEFVVDGLANEDLRRLLEGGVSIAALAWFVELVLGALAARLRRGVAG